MTKHRLRIEVKDGNVNVAWRQGNAEDRSSTSIPFTHPFDEAALTDLRWYLEEYLSYHNLGVVAQKQRQFDTAIDYYQKALKIRESAGNWHSAASDYHQLGVVAQEQRQFDTAIDWAIKATLIYQKYQNDHNAAIAFRILLRIHKELGDTAFAELWAQSDNVDQSPELLAAIQKASAEQENAESES
jgi:tetratricopeptide (TPR) repeat protein